MQLSDEGRSLFLREGGEILSKKAILSTTLLLEVCLPAHERNGRLFLGEKYLPLGEEVVILGQNLAINARLLRFSTVF